VRPRRSPRGGCARRAHPGARIKAVQLADGTATAVVTAPGGVESDVELRKVAGRWLIADF
jgi:hypothetical protein